MTLPLDGIRILDLTQVMLGPCATQLLGDFGADVIKIERPGQGDLSRGSVPDPAGLDNPVFVSLNRNKRSKRIPAAEAYRVGLVNEVVPRTELDAAVDRWLEETLACAPLSLRAIKQSVKRTATLSAEEAQAMRLPAVVKALESEDSDEGVRAFREKRPPNWSGK